MGSPFSAAADHKWKKGKKRMLLFAVCFSPPPPLLFFSCRPSSSHDNPLFLFSANIASPSSPGQWRDHISIPPPPPSKFHNRTPIAINPRRRQSVSRPLHLFLLQAREKIQRRITRGGKEEERRPLSAFPCERTVPPPPLSVYNMYFPCPSLHFLFFPPSFSLAPTIVVCPSPNPEEPSFPSMQ